MNLHSKALKISIHTIYFLVMCLCWLWQKRLMPMNEFRLLYTEPPLLYRRACLNGTILLLYQPYFVRVRYKYGKTGIERVDKKTALEKFSSTCVSFFSCCFVVVVVFAAVFTCFHRLCSFRPLRCLILSLWLTPPSSIPFTPPPPPTPYTHTCTQTTPNAYYKYLHKFIDCVCRLKQR